MNIPKYSPWGYIQHSGIIAEGIAWVSTARHGGVKLDRRRNAMVPFNHRSKGGWYEEDCEWAIAALVHKEAWLDAHVAKKAEANKEDRTWLNAHAANEREKEERSIVETAKNWNPVFYEDFTGIPVTAEESYVVRQNEFKTKHANSLIVTSAWGDWHEDVPAGHVGVMANRGGTRTGTPRDIGFFLITKKEYDERDSEFGFIVDPEKHGEWHTKESRGTKAGNFA